jgi:hypothetical protein
VSAEYSELVEFKEMFDKACEQREKDIEDATLELARELIATVTPLTPVYAPKTIDGHVYNAYEKGAKRTGGELRSRWEKDNKNLSVRRVGNEYVVTVVNNAPYAGYVEDGHKQNVGQRFPIYVDGELKFLSHKKAYIPGQHFLRKAETQLKRKAPSILNAHLSDFMRG